METSGHLKIQTQPKISPKTPMKISCKITPKIPFKVAPKIVPRNASVPKGTSAAMPKIVPKITPKIAPKTSSTSTSPSPKVSIKITRKTASVRANTCSTNTSAVSVPSPVTDEKRLAESPDIPQTYQRWIYGKRMLISIDNKYIYDIDNHEHIGTVLDESTIEWL